MQEEKFKIIFIGVYVGRLPAWINLYLKSCELNREVDWLFFVTEVPVCKAGNITFVKISRQSFAKLVADRLGVISDIKDPRKICDFRPAFGVLFSDYLAGYDFWAHVDWDIIWGDILGFITVEMLKGYDIISSYPYHLAGACTLYRNVAKVNNLFKQNPYYKEAFVSAKHMAFDEIGSHMTEGQFAFGKTVMDASDRQEIKVFLKRLHKLDHCDDDWWQFCQIKLRSEFPKDLTAWGEACWEKGRVFLVDNHEETMYFHFMESKAYACYPYALPWRKDITSIKISKNGFRFFADGGMSRLLYFSIGVQHHFGFHWRVLKMAIKKILEKE